MAENTFPLYKLDQIVAFYRAEVLDEEEGKQFTKNDLNPTVKPETVQMLFMRILQMVYTSFRPACLHMIPLKVQDDIEHPALHEQAAAILSLYQCMRRFLPTCLVFDFALSDLLAPKPKKTAVILSGIMNFLHFRKNRMDFIQEHEGKFRAEMDSFRALTKATKEVEKKLKILTTIPPEQQEEARELNSAITELSAANIQQFQQVTAVNEDIAEWRRKMAERTQALAQLKVSVATTVEENAAVQSQIVESPEELKTQMEKMRESLKTIQAATVKADEWLVEMQIKAQVLRHSDSEVLLIHSLLQDLQTGLVNNTQLQLELDECAVELEKEQKEMKGLHTELDREKRSLAMKRDKLSKQQLRRRKNKETAEHHVQDVMRKCDQVHDKRQEMAEEIQEINNETLQLKAKMQSLLDSCNKETRTAQDLYERLSAALDQLHKRIEAGQDDLQMTLKEDH